MFISKAGFLGQVAGSVKQITQFLIAKKKILRVAELAGGGGRCEHVNTILSRTQSTESNSRGSRSRTTTQSSSRLVEQSNSALVSWCPLFLLKFQKSQLVAHI